MTVVEGKLAIRAGGFRTEDPGFIDDVALGRKDVNSSVNHGGRVALRWQPVDGPTLDASSLYQKRDNDGLPQESVTRDTLAPTAGRYRQLSLTPEKIGTEYQLHITPTSARPRSTRATATSPTAAWRPRR